MNHRKTAHERKQSNSFSVHSLSIVLKWLCLIEGHILRKFNRQFHLLVQSLGHYRQIMFILLPHLNAASLFHYADPAHFTPCKVFIQRTSLFTHTHKQIKCVSYTSAGVEVSSKELYPKSLCLQQELETVLFVKLGCTM